MTPPDVTQSAIPPPLSPNPPMPPPPAGVLPPAPAAGAAAAPAPNPLGQVLSQQLADDWNKQTLDRFDAPTGEMLPQGAYRDSSGNIQNRNSPSWLNSTMGVLQDAGRDVGTMAQSLGQGKTYKDLPADVATGYGKGSTGLEEGAGMSLQGVGETINHPVAMAKKVGMLVSLLQSGNYKLAMQVAQMTPQEFGADGKGNAVGNAISGAGTSVANEGRSGSQYWDDKLQQWTGVDPAKMTAFGSLGGMVHAVSEQLPQIAAMQGAGMLAGKSAGLVLKVAAPQLTAAADSGDVLAKSVISHVSTLAQGAGSTSSMVVIMAGSSAAQAEDSVNSTPIETLMQDNPWYKDQVLNHNADPVRLRAQLGVMAAQRAQLRAMMFAPAAIVGGQAIGRLVARTGASQAWIQATDSAVNNATMQGGSQLASNMGIQVADPKQGTWDHVIGATAGGAAVGGGLSAIGSKLAEFNGPSKELMKNAQAKVNALKSELLVLKAKNTPESLQAVERIQPIVDRIQSAMDAKDENQIAVHSAVIGQHTEVQHEARTKTVESAKEAIKGVVLDKNDKAAAPEWEVGKNLIAQWAGSHGGRTAAEINAATRELAATGKVPDYVEESVKASEPPSLPSSPRATNVTDQLVKQGIKTHVAPDGRVTVPPDLPKASQALDAAAHDAAESPHNDYPPVTPGQALNGNYRVGKSLLKGNTLAEDLKVNIENPAGSIRKAPDGSWQHKVSEHYGYFPGTHGADGDALDLIAGRKATDPNLPVHIIHQTDPKTGEHDELKVVLGAKKPAQARQMYLDQYPRSMHDKLIGGTPKIVTMSRPQFAQWLKAGDHATPVSPISKMPMLKLRQEGEVNSSYDKSIKYNDLQEHADALSQKHGMPLEVRANGDGYGITGTIPKARLPEIDRALRGINGHQGTTYNGVDASTVFPGRRESGSGRIPASKQQRKSAESNRPEGGRVSEFPKTVRERAPQPQAGGLQNASGMGGGDRVLPERARPSTASAKGLPVDVSVHGKTERFGPNEVAQRAAEDYAKSSGVPYARPEQYNKVDVKRATRIAQAYADMEHAPNDPKVKASYKAMIEETLAQWRAIEKTGLKVDFLKPGQSYPYANPREVQMDVRDNNHMWVFPTESGFGSSEADVSENPLLADTGITIHGHKALANDIFRVVHDYFGHIKEGNGFRATGEEHAWRTHAAMYSDLARPAMTSETRGQNSWVNYGPHGESNRTANGEDTVYADQKTGLLPDWVQHEGLADESSTPETRMTDKVGVGRLPDGSYGIVDRAKYQQAVKDYAALKDSHGGKIISADVARELSSDYIKNRTLSADVHEVASQFAKEYFKQKLAEPHAKGSNVLMTAGGTGAGKSVSLEGKFASQADNSDFIYDTNMNTLNSSEDKISKILASGRKVRISFTYRDPVEALTNGALKRAESQKKLFGTGRTVPLSTHAETHTGVMDTMHALADKYANDRRVRIRVIDNTSGKGGEKTSTLENVKRMSDNHGDLMGRLRTALDEALKSGAISKETHNGFSEVSADDATGAAGVREQEPLQRGGSAQGSERGRGVGAVDAAGSEIRSEARPADTVTKAVGKIPQRTLIAAEIAPNPDDAPMTARWNAMPVKDREQITAGVGNEAVRRVADILDIHPGKLANGTGGFEGHVNPNILAAYRRDAISIKQARQLASGIGEALEQKSVVLVDRRAKQSNGIIRISTPKDLTQEQRETIFSEVKKAIPQLDAFTSKGKNFDIINFTGLDDAVVHDKVFAALDPIASLDGFEVAHGRSQSELIGADDYGRHIERVRPGAGQEIHGRLRGVRDWARQRVGEEIAKRAPGIEGSGTAETDGSTSGAGSAEPEISPGAKLRLKKSDLADDSSSHGKDHVAAITDHVQKIRASWKAAPETEVVSDSSDLPPEVRNHLDVMGGAEPDGLYYGGKVYLVGKALDNPAHAERVLVHETLGHYGLQHTFGDQLPAALDDIHDSIKSNPDFLKLVNRYRSSYAGMKPAEFNRAVTEEYLSNRAELQKNPGVLGKIVAFVRNWARGHGMVHDWSENDVTNLMHGVAQNVRQGRVSRYGYNVPTTTFDNEAGTATSSYQGAAGKGTVTHLPDGDRTLSVGGLSARLTRTMTDEGMGLEVSHLSYADPKDLLSITRFAGEEGKSAVLFPKEARDDLDRAHIPNEVVGDHVQTPTSDVAPGAPQLSLRNPGGKPADPELTERMDRTIAKRETEMSPWDRLQHLGRQLASKEAWRDRLRAGFAGAVDQFAPLARIEKSSGGTGKLLDASESAYKAAWMSQNVQAVMGSVVHDGIPVYDKGGFQTMPGRKGWVDILSPLYQHADPEMERKFSFYLGTVRGERLMNEINPDGTSREKNFTPDDIAAGKALEAKYPFFKTVSDDIQKFNHDLIDLAVGRGNMTPETGDAWKANFYVPFYRAMEDEGMASPGQTGGLKVKSKYLSGGGKIEPPLDSMLQNTLSILDRVYKNEAVRRAIAMGQEAGLIHPIGMALDPKQFTVAEIEKRLEDAGLFVGRQANGQRSAKLTLTEADRDKYVNLLGLKPPIAPGSDVTYAMHNGRAKFYRVDDPQVLRAITDITQQKAINRWFSMLVGGPARLLRNLTVHTPSFMFRHLFRQTLDAQLQSSQNPVLLRNSMRSAIEAYTQGPLLRKLAMAGSGGNEYYQIDQMHEEMRRLSPHATILDAPRKLAMAYHKVGYVADQMNRLSVAKGVLDRGGSTAEAAWQAQDLLNFGMHGDNVAVRYLMKAVPFLNARTQGAYRIIRGATGADSPAKVATALGGRLAKGFLYKGALFTAAALALQAKNNGDPRYEKLSDQQKDMYFNFFVGDHHYALPIPFELGAIFATLPSRLLRRAEGIDDNKTLWQSIQRTVESTMRLDPTDVAMITPLWEDQMNKDKLSQRAIVSERYSHIDAPEQFTPYTSPVIKAVAQGMPAAAPDMLRSPLRLQHLVYGYFSTIGRYAVDAADAMARVSGSAPVAPASDSPIGSLGSKVFGAMVSRSSTDPRNNAESVLDDNYRRLVQVGNTINAMKKNGDAEQLNRYYATNGSIMQYKVPLKELYDQMGNAHKAEAEIYQSTSMTADEKRAALNQITRERDAMLQQYAPLLRLVDQTN